MSIRDKAIYLLARREHSRRELTQKLQLRGYTLDEINPLLNDLQTENLLSNDRYASCFIRSRRNRGVGPLKVEAELQKQGLHRHDIRANEEWQEELWHASARSARIKRFGEALPQTSAARAQQTRYLQQRGYTSDEIRFAFLESC